ncbi:hypothetical protein OROMI_007919 [Orobanche minor]
MEVPHSPIIPMFDKLPDENYILPNADSNVVDLFESDLRNAFDNGLEMNNIPHTSSLIPSSLDADVPHSSSNPIAYSATVLDAVLILGDDEVLHSTVSPSPDRSLLKVIYTVDGYKGYDSVNDVARGSGFESDVQAEGVEMVLLLLMRRMLPMVLVMKVMVSLWRRMF